VTTLNPKAARKKKQMAAKERKQAKAEKMRAKKAPRRLLAFIDGVDRWMRREPPEPFTDRCLGCGKDIFVTYEDGRMQHGHVEPVCEAYRALEKITGNESATLESWKNPEADSPLPEWAEGPHEELTAEEGNDLVDSGEVRKSCVASHGLPDGSIATSMIARTGDGLFWWTLQTTRPA
jgi:CRISPR/Cas system-associated protein Cas10 (large subunit of type III CRISPR-Cas system)